MKRPFDPSIACYTVPPSDQLHFAVVQLSERRYAVAEYNGGAGLLDLPSVPTETGCRRMQSAVTFRIVSEPLTYRNACKRLVELYQERYGYVGREMPILNGMKP
jgi:hypothetical protein